jgi:hypothetical protein
MILGQFASIQSIAKPVQFSAKSALASILKNY